VKINSKIKTIQIFNQGGKMILEVSRGFSFPIKYIKGKPVSNVLMLKGRGFPELKPGTVIDVVINTRAGEKIKYFCEVGFSAKNQLNITLNPQRAKQLEERRRFFKIKTAINCRIVDLTRGSETVSLNPKLYGKIYDINLGGIFVVIQTEEKFHEGDILSFSTILADKKLEAAVKVLRSNVSKDGDTVGYGCSFFDIDNHQEAMISSYINYIQIEERRNELFINKMEKEINEEII
jgi:c-di-GMP-binding flagellar brake protein YcgR